MSNIDALLITPPSRAEVYQVLSGSYAAVEPPVWSSLIANYLIKSDYSVKILDAESENLNQPDIADRASLENDKNSNFQVKITVF